MELFGFEPFTSAHKFIPVRLTIIIILMFYSVNSISYVSFFYFRLKIAFMSIIIYYPANPPFILYTCLLLLTNFRTSRSIYIYDS